MASKSQCRNVVKDKNHAKTNAKPSQNVLADEIALRDEILELKRQILLLKKANERNLIKVRKYEDEAKKKDRQIEQLMDPVKNGDVRKLLSTKGAALLLNLKEQNNTLIQMILAKDMQIRKLLSELKTSKLYTSTKRAELYRNEIDRLRNLLIKSQNSVKETQDMQQRRSICVGGGPLRDVTTSSDQSSPRDLEDLHFTIQSLEMHMKYSNELLARKNEQIIQLTDQLNSYQCGCRRNIQTKYYLDSNIKLTQNTSERDFSAAGSNFESTPHNSTFVLTNGSRELSEIKRLPVPVAVAKDFQDDASEPNATPSRKQDMVCADCERESERDLLDNKTHQTRNVKLSDSANETKLEKDKLFVPGNSGFSDLDRILERTSANSLTEEESDVDTEEFEMMEKKIENDQTEIESPVKLIPQVDGCSDNDGVDKTLEEEKFFQLQNKKVDADGRMTPVMEERDATSSQDSKEEKDDKTWSNESGELGEKCEERLCEGNHCGTPENVYVIEQLDAENSESIRDLYRYSSDSSLDSQISTGNPVQVEAEINHNSEMEDDDEVVASKILHENGDDDDDDVIIG